MFCNNHAYLIVGMFFVGVVASVGITAEHWRQQATERHYGGYCETTGVWEWKGECEDE